MKYQTAAQCFGLLLAIGISLFVAESVFFRMIDREAPSFHHALPINGMPFVYNQILGAKDAAKQEAEEKEKEFPAVTVVLKNDSTVSGRLVRDEDQWITLRVDGSEVGFHRSEIIRMTQDGLEDPPA